MHRDDQPEKPRRAGTDAVEIGVCQVEYSNTPQGPLIHVFGRRMSGEAVHLEVAGFRPYFLAPATQVDNVVHDARITPDTSTAYTSIRGELVRRLYTVRPTDVRDLRDRYHPHYEADIPFATRFLIDSGITGGIAAPANPVNYEDVRPVDIPAPARLCFLDIECEDERGFPEPERDKIICITCWDSFNGEYTTLLLSSVTGGSGISSLARISGPQEGVTSTAQTRTLAFHDEVSLLKAFIEYIRTTDPDIFSGWNVLEFDIPYLVKRMETLGLQPSTLSRLPGQTERNAIRGRVIFDLLPAYKKIHTTQRESYRLDSVSEAELGDTKIRYKGRISDLWRDDPAVLVEYNRKDVELCVGINRKNRIIEFYREIARYVGCPLDRTLNSSQVIDIYLLRKAYGTFVLPSKGFVAGEEFEGATVFDPTRGIKENVVVLDLKSLYPMAMMTVNASPETKDQKGELRAPNGVRFLREPDGLARVIISDLMRERDQKKRARDDYPFGSPEYILFDIQQNVLKVIMNTYYGVSGYARFRLYDREIGAAITSIGRAIIDHTRRVIEEHGYSVIYGDTDSCMVVLPPGNLEDTIASARAIEQVLNASYSEFAHLELNADTHFFSIKFEKVYARFFQAGKKKRYAGHLIWKEGKDVDEIDIVGFEIRRSDYPQITKVVQQKIIEQILRGEQYDAIRKYLREVITNYRNGLYPLDEIGIPGGFGKHLGDYQTDEAHVRGARYANEYLGMEFSKGSKPKRVYVKQVTAKYPRTDVLCFEYGDQVPPEFRVDWEMMMEKTLKQPISRIIEALGWDWSDIDPSRTTLAQFGLG